MLPPIYFHLPEAVKKGNGVADHEAASAARASAVSAATAATVLAHAQASLSSMPGAADDEVITCVSCACKRSISCSSDVVLT